MKSVKRNTIVSAFNTGAGVCLKKGLSLYIGLFTVRITETGKKRSAGYGKSDYPSSPLRSVDRSKRRWRKQDLLEDAVCGLMNQLEAYGTEDENQIITLEIKEKRKNGSGRKN